MIPRFRVPPRIRDSTSPCPRPCYGRKRAWKKGPTRGKGGPQNAACARGRGQVGGRDPRAQQAHPPLARLLRHHRAGRARLRRGRAQALRPRRFPQLVAPPRLHPYPPHDCNLSAILIQEPPTTSPRPAAEESGCTGPDHPLLRARGGLLPREEPPHGLAAPHARRVASTVHRMPRPRPLPLTLCRSSQD